MITMNGDLLTDLDFGKMYQTHLEKSAELTIATTSYVHKVPYLTHREDSFLASC